MSAGSKQINFDHFPRVRLGHLPTPIEALPRLSDHLGGPSLFIKRDDCTGLATGGNKTRKLEFLVGEAIEQNADMLVTQGAVQSNHVRQTAAAACKFGMKCHGLLERRVAKRLEAYEETGNVFLDRVFGASLEFREPGIDMNAEAAAAAERLRSVKGTDPTLSQAADRTRLVPSAMPLALRKLPSKAMPWSNPLIGW